LKDRERFGFVLVWKYSSLCLLRLYADHDCITSCIDFLAMGTQAMIAVMVLTLLAMALLPLTLDLRGVAAQSTSDARILSVDESSTDVMPETHSPGKLQSWDLKCSALARSLLAGLSTSIGAGVVLLPSKSPTAGRMAFALSLAGGVMVTVSFVELWLPQLRDPNWRIQAVLFSCLGAVAFFALSRLVPEPDYAADGGDPELGGKDVDLKDQQLRKQKQWRLAVLMMIALTAHNFPEGLAVAISSMESERLGAVVMAAIAVHNIPEGIAIAMPVFDATKSRARAMQMATLSGLAEPLGALVALTLLPEELLQGRGMDALLCIVGGIMTCVAFIELFPEAHSQKRPRASLGGTVAGALIMLLTHEYA